MRNAVFFLVCIVLSTVAIGACGTSDDNTSPVAAGSTITDVPTFNEADVAFAQGMIPHHSQAVEMADMALQRSSAPAILDLATRIQGAQEPEIEQMRHWLLGWGQDDMGADMSEMGHDSAEGMMGEGEMQALGEATGPAFDAMFVDMMIRHHQGAIVMAQTVLEEGTAPENRELAAAVIEAQQGEISEMQAIAQG